MTTSARELAGVTIVDISGRIVLGDESAALRDLVRHLLSMGTRRFYSILPMMWTPVKMNGHPAARKGSLVCLDCGTAEFAVSKSDLANLEKSDPVAAE